MKTLITIEVENEIGNPSLEEVKLFVKQIIEKGLVGNFDIYKYCPMSGISLRVLNTEIEPDFLDPHQNLLQRLNLRNVTDE
jgi:hypothetical protein